MSPDGAPHRDIRFWGAFSVVAGSMLGVGIFLMPAQMAQVIASPWIFLGIWVAAGVVVLGGASVYAELGARMPKAGGDYVYLREAFGPSVAFAAGWGLFGAIFCGSIAAVGVALFQYQITALSGFDLNQAALVAPLVGDVSYAQMLGAGLIFALTWLNVTGVKPSAFMQKLVTLTPVIVLFVVAAIGLGLWSVGSTPAPVPSNNPVLTIEGVVAAYLAAYFAYSGWNAVSYVAGEVEDPVRNIPRSLIGGTVVVGLLYLVLCTVFVLVLGMGGVAASGESGSALAAALAGPGAGAAMNVLILLCLLATLNGSILGGARVAYAMGKGGAFWHRAGRLDRRHDTPAFALWLQAGWASALVLTNKFEPLLRAVSLAMVVIGSLTVISLFVLRRKQPDAPWKAFGYPWLPGLYLASSAVVLFVELRRAVEPGEGTPTPVLGLFIVTTAYLAHLAWRKSLHTPASG